MCALEDWRRQALRFRFLSILKYRPLDRSPHKQPFSAQNSKDAFLPSSDIRSYIIFHSRLPYTKSWGQV
jgi:hypothetical protein